MKRTLEFASHPANLCMMREFVREFAAQCGFAERALHLIVLGLDEACTNVIRHAYGHEDCELITLSCEKLADRVRFRLRDYGKQCDPKNHTGRPIDVVQPGGLGMHLIREAFDQVDYILMKKGTELVLERMLPGSNA